MTIRRILCAVDIDDGAYTAFGQALALARARDAKLLLLCPVAAGKPFGYRAGDRLAYLMRIRREAEAAGVEVHTAVDTGDAAEVILLHASTRRVDVIVIAQGHGRSDGRAWGGVAEDVLRAAPCPTLVVPVGASDHASFRTVLWAVDLASGEPAPLTRASGLLDAHERRLAVLHVAGRLADATTALSRVQALMPPGAFSPAVARVAVGAPGPEILKAVGSMQTDLLVIGARARNRLSRRLFGVTRALLTDAPCPVLAIPPGPAGATGRTDRHAA